MGALEVFRGRERTIEGEIPDGSGGEAQLTDAEGGACALGRRAQCS